MISVLTLLTVAEMRAPMNRITQPRRYARPSRSRTEVFDCLRNGVPPCASRPDLRAEIDASAAKLSLMPGQVHPWRARLESYGACSRTVHHQWLLARSRCTAKWLPGTDSNHRPTG